MIAWAIEASAVGVSELGQLDGVTRQTLAWPMWSSAMPPWHWGADLVGRYGLLWGLLSSEYS